MITRSFPASVLALLVLSASPWPACAQAGPQSGYRLQANSRVVLMDVTVTDKRGNPVRGLKVSDFRIFDNNKPQKIASFEENSERDTVPGVQAVPALGVYSNDYVVHPPRVLNIVLLDLTNISIEDQMYLNYQLGKLFDALRPDEPVAIYARTAGASILLQSFTSDRALLRAAIKRVIPRFPPPDREYLSDFQTLRQIELYLQQIPGRKNVLWFSGGSTLFLPDAAPLSTLNGWRDVYDELESQRIAIYPIDARGLTTAVPPGMLAQHAIMSNVAEATGGRAVYDYNGLALAAGQIVDNDSAYYTLTYAPRDFVYNNKWHKVRITVRETDYTLSYRRGYFADGAHSAVQRRPDQARTQLLPTGETTKVADNAPIVFQASVHEGMVAAAGSSDSAKPERPHGGTKPFTVHYSLPLDAFASENIDGKEIVNCGVAAIAFNGNGTLIARHGQKITFTLKNEAAIHPDGKLLPIDLVIDLPAGDAYLYLAAWDIASKRLGTLEIPYRVMTKKASQRPTLP